MLVETMSEALSELRKSSVGFKPGGCNPRALENPALFVRVINAAPHREAVYAPAENFGSSAAYPGSK
jgi:hypothetical protein